jgi:hypothetical protein
MHTPGALSCRCCSWENFACSLLLSLVDGRSVYLYRLCGPFLVFGPEALHPAPGLSSVHVCASSLSGPSDGLYGDDMVGGQLVAGHAGAEGAPHLMGEGSGPHAAPGSPPVPALLASPELPEVLFDHPQSDSDDEDGHPQEPSAVQLAGHCVSILTAAVAFNMPNCPDLEPWTSRVLSGETVAEVAADLTLPDYFKVLRVCEKKAHRLQMSAPGPTTYAPHPSDLHLGRVPGRARGLPSEQARWHARAWSRSLLAIRDLMPLAAVTFGHLSPASVNFLNHAMTRLHHDVKATHLSPYEQSRLFSKEAGTQEHVWHANVHPVSSDNPGGELHRVHCYGVQHQPLDTTTQRPSNCLPAPGGPQFVGLRLEQATPVSLLEEQPKTYDRVGRHFCFTHPEHTQFPPSACFRRHQPPSSSAPVIITDGAKGGKYLQRKAIYADSRAPMPFGISNQNELTWISRRLVDANQPGLVVRRSDLSGAYFDLEGQDVKCRSMLDNFVVVIFQSHSVVAEVITKAYILELEDMPETKGARGFSDGCLGHQVVAALQVMPTHSTYHSFRAHLPKEVSAHLVP